MVIERALEKLRQAAAHSVAERATPHEPAMHGPSTAHAANVPPPTLPRVHCDQDAMVAHRILPPDTSLVANARALAAYRMIRTRLLHATRNNNLRSLAVTSPGPGDGKSVTAINLAFSLSRDPATNVVLLDLDMRNPSICRYLGARPPVDLVSYFMGSRAASDVLFSIGPANLAIAGAVTSTDDASELLAPGRLEALMAYVASVYSKPIILLDLPPILVTDEALLLAPRVDATLLVVAEGRTRRDSLARAVSMLEDFTCVGVILNRTTEPLEGNAYYYDYT